MKNIKTYEDFINEEINLRKALAGAALGAGLAFGNPAIGQTLASDLSQKGVVDFKKNDIFYKDITKIINRVLYCKSSIYVDHDFYTTYNDPKDKNLLKEKNRYSKPVADKYYKVLSVINNNGESPNPFSDTFIKLQELESGDIIYYKFVVDRDNHSVFNKVFSIVESDEERIKKETEDKIKKTKDSTDVIDNKSTIESCKDIINRIDKMSNNILVLGPKYKKLSIHKKIILWISENFKNPDKVIQINDKDLGIIVINFNSSKSSRTIEYKIQIQIVDGKIKIKSSDIKDIDNNSFTYESIKNIVMNSDLSNKSRSEVIKKWGFLFDIEMELSEINDSIKDYINKKDEF